MKALSNEKKEMKEAKGFLYSILNRLNKSFYNDFDEYNEETFPFEFKSFEELAEYWKDDTKNSIIDEIFTGNRIGTFEKYNEDKTTVEEKQKIIDIFEKYCSVKYSNFTELEAIVNKKVDSYKSDFYHIDALTLSRKESIGKKFVFIVRDCGTQLIDKELLTDADIKKTENDPEISACIEYKHYLDDKTATYYEVEILEDNKCNVVKRINDKEKYYSKCVKENNDKKELDDFKKKRDMER